MFVVNAMERSSCKGSGSSNAQLKLINTYSNQEILETKPLSSGDNPVILAVSNFTSGRHTISVEFKDFSSQDYVCGMILSNDWNCDRGYHIHPFITLNDAQLIKFDCCGFTVAAQVEAYLPWIALLDQTFIFQISVLHIVSPIW